MGLFAFNRSRHFQEEKERAEKEAAEKKRIEAENEWAVLTVPQLKDLAKYYGIKGYDDMRKPELQKALVEAGA